MSDRLPGEEYRAGRSSGERTDGPELPLPDDAGPIPRVPRDASYWAAPVQRLGAVSDAARSRGLEGKRLMGPQQGFGQLWQRNYRVPLPGVDLSAAQVVGEWKARFGEFWPSGGSFHAPLAGIAPGELAALDVGVGQLVLLSTGVFVLYADETSFTFMTPQGHMFTAWITFAAEEDGGTRTAEVSMLLRAADPVAEVAYLLGAARMEDRFWIATLTNLAAALGAERRPVVTRITCVDRRRQWRRWTNLRHNGGPRTLIHGFRAPRG
ncbi:hypothetical protein [Blastococcus saxobsidens]|uniref:Uncharacterized protein n=1 Tax=Blastococcus saxobsidens TaxID=138336 RepID=A0A4Q7Y1X5_9ACTN|nr:hypothetical protein [Blastococcus saxobsidens]RZU30800.1 hypothetical protein BKA19_0428 [Blastococcus saxobsidens]